MRRYNGERKWMETVEQVCPYRKPPPFEAIPVLMDRCGFTGRPCCYKDCPAIKMKRRR